MEVDSSGGNALAQTFSQCSCLWWHLLLNAHLSSNLSPSSLGITSFSRVPLCCFPTAVAHTLSTLLKHQFYRQLFPKLSVDYLISHLNIKVSPPKWHKPQTHLLGTLFLSPSSAPAPVHEGTSLPCEGVPLLLYGGSLFRKGTPQFSSFSWVSSFSLIRASFSPVKTWKNSFSKTWKPLV